MNGRIVSRIEQLIALFFVVVFFFNVLLEGKAFEEPTSPDITSGHVVAHVVKARTVYVTPTEEFWLSLMFWLSVGSFAAIVFIKLLQKAQKK